MCFLFIFHVRIHNNALQCLTLYRSLSSSSQIHGNTFSYFGVCIFVKLRQYIAIYWRHRCLNRRQCNLLAEAQNRKYGATPELIFVTNITNYICGEKIVIWRNIGKIWEILPQFTRFHVEKNWAQKVHLWRKNDKYEVYGGTPLNNLRQKHLRTKNDCQHHSPDRNFKIIKVIRMRIVMMMMMLMMIIMMMMKKSLGGSQKCQERT